ncbi:MAG: hypothetical protein ACOCVZ_05135 [Gemmatimonadota bacterium]
MKATLGAALVAACLVGLAAPAAAQVPGVELTLNPRAGLYIPLTDLGDAGSIMGSMVTEQSGTLALGLGAELRFAGPVGVRANLDYATGSEISAEGLGETVERTVVMLAGDLVFRPLPRLVVVQPYLYAGGGLRQYDFDFATPQDAGELEDASDPMIHLGGGLELGLGPLAVNAEIGDYISWLEIREGADSELQHDLFVSVGVVLSLL